MTTHEYYPATKFDYSRSTIELTPSLEKMSAICLSLADLCIRYSGVERVPRYHETHRENDAEHSLMVAVLSVELASTLRPELDRGTISQYATVHDFVEIAVGDTPTYGLSDQELLDKHRREQAALTSLAQTLPPYTAELLLNYEEQSTPEARFVRAVDKLTPLLVDILGPGRMVMREDYGITSVAELIENKLRLDDSMVRRFGEDNPEIVELYEYLGELFTQSYQEEETRHLN
ncbi:MAG TPA: HD domain-containing protein [Candidatus Saccharimonadales bacterium]